MSDISSGFTNLGSSGYTTVHMLCMFAEREREGPIFKGMFVPIHLVLSCAMYGSCTFISMHT